jgi:hypothetical protein
MSTPVKTIQFPQRQIIGVAQGVSAGDRAVNLDFGVEFSIQQLAMIREAVLSVVDDTPRLIWENQFTEFVADRDAIINEQRLRLCDAVQKYITDRTMKS